MFALIANGGPPLFPQSDSPMLERAVWGACMSVAALLGGWGVLNRNRPSRDTAVGVSILVALVLVAGCTLFVMTRGNARQMERNRIEREGRDRELRDRENGETSEGRPPR